MIDVNFFGGAASDSSQDPQARARAQAMARALMQGSAPQQGQSVGGHYVAPSPLSYVNQIANGYASGVQARGMQRNANVAAANQSADPIGSLGTSMGSMARPDWLNGVGDWLRGSWGGGS